MEQLDQRWSSERAFSDGTWAGSDGAFPDVAWAGSDGAFPDGAYLITDGLTGVALPTLAHLLGGLRDGKF
jgi:hypothetical protein